MRGEGQGAFGAPESDEGPYNVLIQDCLTEHGPFHLIYTPPYVREFLRGFEKAVSEGLCASASFDLGVFSEG